MQLILLISFILPGCLAREFYIAPDYEYRSNQDVSNNEDYSPFENPAIPVSMDNSRPAPKYMDLSEYEKKIPANQIMEEENNVNGEKVMQARDSEADNIDSVMSDTVKSTADGSVVDINNEMNDNRNDYRGFKNVMYPYAYFPVRNNLQKYDEIKPYSKIGSEPSPSRDSTIDSGTYNPVIFPFVFHDISSKCRNGYRPDANGRCRLILG